MKRRLSRDDAEADVRGATRGLRVPATLLRARTVLYIDTCRSEATYLQWRRGDPLCIAMTEVCEPRSR